MKVQADRLVLRCEYCGEEVALDEAGSMLADPQRFVDKHRNCLVVSAHHAPEQRSAR